MRSGMEYDYSLNAGINGQKDCIRFHTCNIIVPLRKVAGILGESFCRPLGHVERKDYRVAGQRDAKGRLWTMRELRAEGARFRRPTAHETLP
jgi:hypothetical protein